MAKRIMVLVIFVIVLSGFASSKARFEKDTFRISIHKTDRGGVIQYYRLDPFRNKQVQMTDKQVVAAVKLVRNMCLGKAKTTPDEIEEMHQGNWDVDHNARIDKENHIDRTSADVQIKQLPDLLYDYVVKCLDKCEHSATNLDDKCEAAWEYSKCMYFCDPEKYFLP